MFKVFRRECLYGLDFECNRFDFDYEIVIKLLRKGYKPLELPVNYRSRSMNEGKKGHSFSRSAYLDQGPRQISKCAPLSEHRSRQDQSWRRKGIDTLAVRPSDTYSVIGASLWLDGHFMIWSIDLPPIFGPISLLHETRANRGRNLVVVDSKGLS